MFFMPLFIQVKSHGVIYKKLFFLQKAVHENCSHYNNKHTVTHTYQAEVKHNIKMIFNKREKAENSG